MLYHKSPVEYPVVDFRLPEKFHAGLSCFYLLVSLIQDSKVVL